MKAIGAVLVCGLLMAAGFMLGGQAPGVPVPGFVHSYVTHVSTDKPIYRTGERVYVRGVVLSADGHTPLTGGESARAASFEIRGPRGNIVGTGAAAITDSVIGFSWDIPSSEPGGEYIVRVSHPLSDLPSERKFDIRAYRAPRLKSQIVFVRDGYGPGDTVDANLHVERAEGGVPARAKVAITARIDGQETWTGTATVDNSGNASTSFKLPTSIARGDGVLAMTIEDGGIVETATKTIPILLQTLDLAIYPEGGDLIAGLPNRVYVEGKTPAQKPADMAGVIVNAAGKQVAAFRTEHEGRGRFSFVPVAGEKYSLRLHEPAGIHKAFPMPEVKEAGVVISSTSDVIAKRNDVHLRVGATATGDYDIVLSRRGKEISFKSIRLRANEISEVSINLPRSIDGVIVATVLNDHQKPLAERLLFRQPEHNVKVTITPDRPDYVPGDKVTLRVSTTDEFGRPMGSVVGLTVTDSSVLEMIEKREQAPRLPVMVLLENEVKDLADAHVYLDETNAKAPLATDLLLGTQGWRRFANVGTGSFSGTVMDMADALIPGATVTATHTGTGAVIQTTTNARGEYAFQAAPAGMYRVTTTLPGFQMNTAGVQVVHDRPMRQDFRLNVAMVAEMIQVEAVAVRKAGPFKAALAPPAPPVALPQPAAIAVDEIDAKQKKDQPVQPVFDQRAIRGVFGGVARADFARNEMAAVIQTVREYAHTLRPNWTEGSRVDFTETVYWNAGVKTDAATGLATVSFRLSDSVTAFRIFADSFSADGSLGSATSEIASVQPFSIEPKFPLQVTSGDVIQLPIGIVNGVARELRGAEVMAKGPAGLQFTMLGGNGMNLRPNERTRRFMQIDVARDFRNAATITLDGKAGAYRDTVTRTLDVQPLGFPREASLGGLLESNNSKSFEFTIPNGVVPGSVFSTVTVYPTPLASMTDALRALIQQPYGCFEQTSSTSYPMVMAQQYFSTHTGVDPSIIEKARNLLDDSYKKLTGFESPNKGYEWFGADPGHEALTAYGLLQFTDMSRVRTVDKNMLDRTRSWLLARRDGNGGFRTNSKALDTFGRAPVDTTNAYIVWALLESGETGLAKEIAAIKNSAASTQDTYIVALAASVLYMSGDKDAGRQLMDKLAKNQDSSGSVKGAVTSITQSGGESLIVETTALSVLAWLREPSYALQVEKGIRWLAAANKNGRFGSTQSTILALRAIVAYDKAHARPKAPGRLILTLDGNAVGKPVAFSTATQGALVMPEFADQLRPGKHTVALRMEDGSNMPFAMNVRYNSLTPESADQAKIAIQVTLTDSQIKEGAVTEANVSIANKSDDAIPTPVAIIGIPGGLEVRHDQLKELVKSGKIAAYEVIGREVVLYWRAIKAKDKFDLRLSLIAAIPGSYTGPASRAYLYYTDEYKSWTPGLKVTIQ